FTGGRMSEALLVWMKVAPIFIGNRHQGKGAGGPEELATFGAARGVREDLEYLVYPLKRNDELILVGSHHLAVGGFDAGSLLVDAQEQQRRREVKRWIGPAGALKPP